MWVFLTIPQIISVQFLLLQKGVACIEKHFTIDNDLPGRDNRFALLPNALKEISDAAQRYVSMSAELGMEFLPEEREVRDIYRGRWCGAE